MATAAGWLFNNASAYARSGAPPLTAPPMTWLIVAQVESLTAAQCLGIITAAGQTAQNFRFQINATTGTAWFATAGGSTSQAQSTNAVSAGVPFFVVGTTSSATDRRVILNGDFANAGTNATSRAPAGINRISYGQKDDASASNPVDGSIFYSALWNVVLTDDEIAAISAGAWPGMVRPTALVGFWHNFGMGGGGSIVDLSGAANLAVNLGTESAAWVRRFGPRRTATVLPFKATYTLDATTAGAFAHTGQAALLLRGRRLDATTAGSFALGGQTANLLRSRRMIADAMALALIGYDAGLVRLINFLADAGTFTLTGQAATLVPARRIAAEAASFAITPQTVALTYRQTQRVRRGWWDARSDEQSVATDTTTTVAELSWTADAGQSYWVLANPIFRSGTAGVTVTWVLEDITGAAVQLHVLRDNARDLADVAGRVLLVGQLALPGAGQRTLRVTARHTGTLPIVITGSTLTVITARAGDRYVATATASANLTATLLSQSELAWTAPLDGADYLLLASANVRSSVGNRALIDLWDGTTSRGNADTRYRTGSLQYSAWGDVLHTTLGGDQVWQIRGAAHNASGETAIADSRILALAIDPADGVLATEDLTKSTTGSADWSTKVAADDAVPAAPYLVLARAAIDVADTTNLVAARVTADGVPLAPATVIKPGTANVDTVALLLAVDLVPAAVARAWALEFDAPNGAGLAGVYGASLAVLELMDALARPAAYALAGTEAALLFHRRLDAEAGDFALAGQAATLTRDRVLVVDQGDFFVAAQDATLLPGYRLDAGAGSFSHTDQAATLLRSRRLDAGAGAVTLAGQAAALLAARQLVAAAAAFVEAGQDAALLRGYPLSAAAAAFVLAGQAAAFKATRLIDGGSGAVALTGQAASLVVGYRLVADAGSFAHTGQDAALLRGYRLDAGAGTTGEVVRLGAERGDMTGWTNVSGSPAATQAEQANGAWSYLFPTDPPTNRATVPIGSQTSLRVSFRTKASLLSIAGDNMLVSTPITTTWQLGFATSSATKLGIRRSSVLLGTGINDMPANQWVTIVMELVSGGNVRVWMNGVLEINVAMPAIVANTGLLFIGYGGGVSYFDDIVVSSDPLASAIDGADASEPHYRAAGQSAGLTAARRLGAGAGSFMATGQDAALVATRRLDATTAGAFSLAGQLAALLRGYPMPAAAAAFALSGQIARLLAGYTVPAGAGAIVATGQDAVLRTGYRLDAQAGSFAHAGQAAILTRTRLLVAAEASFTLAGQAAALVAGRRLDAGAGAFAEAGQDARLLVGRRLDAGAAGAFTHAGQAATLALTRVLAAAAGSVVLTGQAARLLAGYRVTADAARFDLVGFDALTPLLVVRTKRLAASVEVKRRLLGSATPTHRLVGSYRHTVRLLAST